MTTTRFSGRLMGVEYDDPKLFERAAAALGFKSCRGRVGKKSWALGTAVAVILDGERVEGQVWSKASAGYVWIALDNGRYVAVSIRTAAVLDRPAGKPVGQVA